MRGLAGILVSIGFILLAAPPSSSTEQPPPWAYPVNPPDFKPRPEDGILRQVPGSTAKYSVSELRDRFIAPVWHPGEHPALPQIVATGRKPNVFACGFCHREDGSGGPENSSLAGLPAHYIIQQMADYKTGARRSSVPTRAPVALMTSLSKDITDDEVREAAAYFSAVKPRSNIKVVETDTVPKTFIAGWFLAASSTVETEPLDQRIIEVPEDLEQFENRDPKSRFIAYVPNGSIAKGAALVGTGGAGKTLQCSICHGPDLKGLASIPPSRAVRRATSCDNSTICRAAHGLESRRSL